MQVLAAVGLEQQGLGQLGLQQLGLVPQQQQRAVAPGAPQQQAGARPEQLTDWRLH